MLQFHKNYELRLKVEGIQQEELKYLFRQKRFPQTISAMRFGMVKKVGQNQNENVQNLSKTCPKMFKSVQKSLKLVQNLQKYPKIAGFSFKILLPAKCAGYTFKILLLVSKPTGHEVPRCRNNLQLWT